MLRFSKPFIRIAAALLVLPAVGGCNAAQVEAGANAQLAETGLTVITAKGERAFRVEIARTPDEQAKGLMFRKTLPQGRGMIFPMNPPRVASFWMKNTLIPLDMIFIRSDMTIARIEPDTVPESLDPVSSGEPVIAVFEIAGGESARLGIAEGDRVQWSDPEL